MNISQFIVKARRKLGLSQKGLAEALGVSQGSVSKWEAGKESPRAETVERIRELSGMKYPEPATDQEQEDEFATFCEVPYRGSFTDGYTYAPFNAGQLNTLMLYLKRSIAENRLEAWAVKGMYPNLPRSFLGVFRLLDAIEKRELRSHPARSSRVLTQTVRPDGTVSFSIEEVNGDERTGYWLWPTDRSTKSRNLPVRLIDAEGDERDEQTSSTEPYGVLVAIIYEPSPYPPRSTF